MKPKERYGILTATAMIVGTVIGSGVFFKTGILLQTVQGGYKVLVAWVVGGICMVLCLLSFACAMKHYGSKNGLPGIAEKSVTEGYSYYVGWFMATIYYPTMVCVLSWLSAVYTLIALGLDGADGGLCMILACVYLIISFMHNALFPVFSGRVQVVATSFKLIPLILMIVLGLYRGLDSGVLRENLLGYSRTIKSTGTLPAAISSVMFAYEGWIASLSIGDELKNSKRNLPIALVLGGSLVAFVYVFYSMGIMGSVPQEVFLNYGNEGIKIAFASVLGDAAAELLTAFVAISCIGALNGMMFGLGRAMYSVCKNGNGPAPKLFSRVDDSLGTPVPSFIIGLFFSVLWLFFFFGYSLSEKPLFGGFGFDISEIPVITVYVMYIPIFVRLLREKLSAVSRVIVVGGILSCVLVAISAFYAHYRDILDYLAVFAAVMLVGAVFRKNKAGVAK